MQIHKQLANNPQFWEDVRKIGLGLMAYAAVAIVHEQQYGFFVQFLVGVGGWMYSLMQLDQLNGGK